MWKFQRWGKVHTRVPTVIRQAAPRETGSLRVCHHGKEPRVPPPQENGEGNETPAPRILLPPPRPAPCQTQPALEPKTSRVPTCEGLLDPAGLRHLHGHHGRDVPRAARKTAGEGGTWGEERTKLNGGDNLAETRARASPR